MPRRVVTSGEAAAAAEAAESREGKSLLYVERNKNHWKCPGPKRRVERDFGAAKGPAR